MKICWHIGTSGWSYDDWKRIFYPPGHLSASKHLPYFSTQFKTTEINATFYRIMKEEIVRGWHDKTPDDFTFSIKLHQYFTHSKRMKIDQAADSRLDMFLKSISQLEHKTGPILVQLPPHLKADPERLRAFLEAMPDHDYAIEFRHKSWFTDKTKHILEDYNAAMVYSHSPELPTALAQTASFFYARFHGPGEFYKTKYTKEQLKAELDKILNLEGINNCKSIYIYFNNNYKGYAVDNAKHFKLLTEKD
ncbi:MAG: DUF72 domain-containing protein [Bacteroidales bacterium]|nr:DUF72 domain-containing protein [Bacteroidales bacterium]